MNIVERTQRIADQAAKRFDTTHIAREWWAITTPDGSAFEFWVPHGMTQAEVLKHYPHCGVLPK